jgi:hypothetical protein
MANFQGINPFCLFFWGMDRFGAWPFLLLNALRFNAFQWSPAGLSACLVFFVFLGAWPLYRLCGKRIWVVPVYIALIVLHPATRLHLFELAQVYPWQIPTILWTWYCLRKLAATRSIRFYHLAIAGLLSLLATWSSALSGPLLIALGLVEWRFWIKRETASKLLMMSLPGVIGIVGESILRGWFHRYAIMKFDHSYRTHIGLDVGHLWDNAQVLGARLFSHRWWILPAIGFVIAVMMVIESFSSFRKQNRNVSRTGDELEPVVIGSIVLALLSFIVATSVMHVRENDYMERYLTPVHLFGNLGGAAAVASILRRWSRTPARGRPLLTGILTVLTSSALWLAFPVSRSNPRYQDLEAASAWLAAQPKQHVLLGGYWGTYVFASSNIPGAIVPVPAEGEYQRTPWTTGSIRTADEIIVSLYHYDRFGSSIDPEPWILESGSVLRRIERSRWSVNEIVFWKYGNESSRKLEVTANADLKTWNACDAGRRYSVVFEPIGTGHLLLWADPDAEVPAVRVVGIDPGGGEHQLAVTHQGGRLRSYAFGPGEGAISGIWLSPAEKSKNCRIAGLAVVRES